MAKYKLVFDRETCIGALACLAVDQKHWEEARDGKVNLKGATLNPETGNYELVIDEEDLELAEQAATVCPVNAIRVERIE